MASSKRMNLICVIAVVLSLLVSVLLPASGAETPVQMAYENKLFDTSRVHTIDIAMNDWDGFIETCTNEEYAACDVTVDGEKYKNVAIRAKGNTSLSSVSSMNSDRYSFKIEFDHYDSAFSYHGLDKLSLNNLIQDNTYMKDYVTYRMMHEFDVPAPLTSFVYITVNGEDWGLYLAVEGVEDAFLMRNYGKNYGELYKPDSLSFGGGRGNGRDFDMGDFEDMFGGFSDMQQGGFSFDFMNQTPPTDQPAQMPTEMPDSFDMDNPPGGFGGFGMGSNDVKLVYTDDDFDSYSNIFDNAKTDVTDADKTRLINSIKRLNEGDSAAVDIEDVIRYFVVHNFVVNDDSYTGTMIHNYYLYEKNGVLSMIPWDYNLAFGTFQGGKASSSVNKDILNPVSGGSSDRPMINWIFESEEYTEMYRTYFSDFLNTVDAMKIIEDAQALISAYVEKDPTSFCTYEEFEKGVSALKTFVELRSQSVKNQLNGSNETVNASGLNASDMGTMGGGNGGFSMPEMPFGDRGGKEKTGEEASAIPTGVPDNMQTGNFQIPDMLSSDVQPSSGDPSGMPASGTAMPDGFQMPTDGTAMPDGFQMPTDGSSGMPSDSFTMPDAQSSGNAFQVNPEQTQMAEESAESSEGETETPTATASQPAGNPNPSGFNPGADRSNGFDFPGMPGTDTAAQSNTSSQSLLIASIIVLILSIAVALIIKH